jgi:putative ABC transport system permease protein
MIRLPRRRQATPPALARLLIAFLSAGPYRDQQLGDLEEAFLARREADGSDAARRWYWRQVVKSAAPNLAIRTRPPRGAKPRSKQPMETVFQDLRYGIRSLIKNPAFTAVSTVTLALAIGVNTAIFSLVNALVFADLPMNEAETAVIFRNANAQLGIERGSFSFPDFLDFRDQSQSFEGIAAWRGGQWALTNGGEPLRVDGYRVTDNLLDVWRLGTVTGRGFLPGEDQPGAPPVAMLSHGFWIRQYAGREEVVGSQLRLDGREYTVVGVISPEMEFAELAEAEVWLPLDLDRASEVSREQRNLFLTGRLKEGVTGQQAYDEILAIGARLAEEYPATHRGWEPHAFLAEDGLLDSEAKTILLLLVLTVGFVLLIACANVANMLLARASARSREMAVRAALGAGRVRLVRQLLTESFVIAGLSAAIGLGLSRGLMQGLVTISNGREVVFMMAEIDGNVLFFTLIVSLITPLAFGLLPALKTSAEDVGAALKEGSARSGGRKGNRTRGVLVGAQVSLALMLMVVAGLLVRSVIQLEQRELGFDATNILSVRIGLPESKYGDDDARRQFFEQLTERVEGLPGVASVALATVRPVAENAARRSFEIEGQPPVDEADRPTGRTSVVTPEYFDVLGIPTVSGRTFTTNDTDASFEVAVIAQETARRYWPDEDPIGRRFRIGVDETAPWVQIVGVVADTRSSTSDERVQPMIYLPFAQNPLATLVVLARAQRDALALSGAVRNAVWSLDPDQPVDDVRTMEQALYDAEATGYALISLFVAFAVFALCMAAVGIYGVMSYAVSQRASEISIRMALGARAGHVRLMILSHGGKLVVLGAIVGLAGAALLSRLLQSLVFGISTLDPVTFLGVPAILGIIGMLANYVPARRATRIDPMKVLRVE